MWRWNIWSFKSESLSLTFVFKWNLKLNLKGLKMFHLMKLLMASCCPLQVAIIAGNFELAELIKNHKDSDIGESGSFHFVPAESLPQSHSGYISNPPIFSSSLMTFLYNPHAGLSVCCRGNQSLSSHQDKPGADSSLGVRTKDVCPAGTD